MESNNSSRKEPWWKHAVFYEVYPRSFMDSDGDGVGDLNGITSKLDHLVELGVDAVWLTPFYPSPQVDFGYDISDYEAVDPQFGTLADFDRLVAEAHGRGIRVVTDLVLNHTSDSHPFFVESRSSRENPKRDWYVWRDPKPGGGPPNNWFSVFAPSAWTLDERTGQYYYHFFYPQQPDLNWRNPEVERAVSGWVRFWLDRGVDGFRLDAINYLFEDERLRDNPITLEIRPGTLVHEQDLKYNCDLPEVHDVLRRLRALTDGYGGERVLIGEACVPTHEMLRDYYGENSDGVQLPLNFFFVTEAKKLDAAVFRDLVEKNERELGGQWTTLFLSNHDVPRAYDRLGEGPHNDEIAKLLALMLLSLRGTPFIYYGEEIGMLTTEPLSLEEVRDPVGKVYWPGYKGRDGERTPMQWDSTPNAGFTTGTPWLRVPPCAVTHNVAAQSGDPKSILNFYKRAMRLRRESPALLEGDYVAFGDDPHIFAYRRSTAEQSLLVALNMSNERRTLRLGGPAGVGGVQLRVRLSSVSPEGCVVTRDELVLAPYEGVVAEVLSGEGGTTH